MSDDELDDQWAEQVPNRRSPGEYEDYGWESGQSVLPGFRDPSVHSMPYEQYERDWRRRYREQQAGPSFGRAYDTEHAGLYPTATGIDSGGGHGYARPGVYYGVAYRDNVSGQPHEGGYGRRRDEWNPPPGPHSGQGPRGYQRSNDAIREEASERLSRHGQVDASDIELVVDSGEITLKGTVPSRRQKRLAGDALETVPGVKEVHNLLRIWTTGRGDE